LVECLLWSSIAGVTRKAVPVDISQMWGVAMFASRGVGKR
jgi:hypothetical protein